MATRARICVALLTVSIVGASTNPSALSAQEDEPAIIGYTVPEGSLATDAWVDPIIELELSEDSLEPLPDFDFSTLHDSVVFASGVDWIGVVDDNLPEQAYRHQRALQVLATLKRDESALAAEIVDLHPKVLDLDSRIGVEGAHLDRLGGEIQQFYDAITELAIRAFLGDEQLDTAAMLSPTTDVGQSRVLTREVRDRQFAEISTRENERDRRLRLRATLQLEHDALAARLEMLRRERRGLLEDIRDVDSLSDQTTIAYRTQLHDQLTETVSGTRMQLVALNAYVVAERVVAVERPTCGIQWWMLAGIGQIESAHGQFGSSLLDVNGSTTEAITGPALDGRILSGSEFLEDGTEAPVATVRTETTPVASSGDDSGAEIQVVQRLALIPDTDAGALDDDTIYDRAVGPLQFIPQTWRQYQADGNGDEANDPQNIYDAALAAARYLCVAAGSMTTEEGQRLAYFAYNHDEVYSDSVIAASHTYRDHVHLPDDPEGSATALGIYEWDPELQSDPLPEALNPPPIGAR